MMKKLIILIFLLPFLAVAQLDYYLVLPPESSSGIPVIVGETTTLYGNTLINIPIEPVETYTWEYICDVGNTVGENFVITPTSGDIGRHRLIVDVKKDGTTIARDTTTLSVHRRVNIDAFSIHPFGDSNMNNMFDSEFGAVESVFNETTITTYGIYTSPNGRDHNAIGGASYNYYLNNSASPLTKDGAYDVPAYFVDNDFPLFDYVYVKLGSNDLNTSSYDVSGISESDLNTLINRIKAFVDGFLEVDAPDLKIIIGIPPIISPFLSHWTNTYGGTDYEDKHDFRVQNHVRYNEAIINTFMDGQYDDKVFVSLASFFLDRSTHGSLHHYSSVGAEQIGFGLASTINQLLDEESDQYIEESDQYIIYNPYYGVDWSPAKHYKANFSALTTESVGSENPATVINAYANAGYRILSIADETHPEQYRSNTWPWTDYIAHESEDYYKDVEIVTSDIVGHTEIRSALFPTLGDTVLAVMGNTLTGISNPHFGHYVGMHLIRYDYVSDALSSIVNFETSRGRGIFTRVGETSRSAAWYNNNYLRRTIWLKGFEVFNQGNRYEHANVIQLWDQINATRDPNDLIWGYSNDYMTETSHLFRNYQHFLYKESENWLSPFLTERRLRQAMFDGSFYFSYEPDGNNSSSPTYGQADAPKLMGVTTSNSLITITGENYTSIEWYNNQSTLVGTGNSIDVSTVSGNFVRAVLVNSSGYTYTQPFGFKLKNEPYFVAPDGNDSNPGTKEAPFLTAQHAVKQLTPGDTLYLRGGVYHITQGLEIRYGTNQSYYGTEQYPIVVSAYPPDHATGNVPVIDGITACDFGNEISGIVISNIQWWKLWGITVRNILQCTDWQARMGIFISSAYNITLDQCIVHNIGGYGIWADGNVGFNTVTRIRNVDVYNLCDTIYNPPNTPGGRGSGITVSGPTFETEDPNNWTEHHVTGTRVWSASDNSYNVIGGNMKMVLDSTWAILPGIDTDGNYMLDGDGRGYPLNWRARYAVPALYSNSIVAYARSVDFVMNSTSNWQSSGIWYNNLSIGGQTWTHPEIAGAHPTNAWRMRESANNIGATITLKNNVAYGRSRKMTSGVAWIDLYDNEMSYSSNWNWDNPQGYNNPEPTNAVYTHEHNTWNYPEMWLDESDFVGPMDSLSIVTALLAPRKEDGSLPDVPNLWPSSASQLRNAGTEVSYDYYGMEFTLDYYDTNPTLGPFQYNPDVTGHILIFQIENENGNAINNASITFNGATRPPGVYTLTGIEEGTYDFSVNAPGYETYTQTGLLVEGDMEIQVVMSLNNYQINLSASPAAGGSVTGQGSYQHGQTVQVSAQAHTGYNFVNWTENGNVFQPIQTTLLQQPKTGTWWPTFLCKPIL
jgi:hypothetical protein